MDSVHLSAFVVLFHLIVLLSAEEEIRHHPNCPPFPCGKLGKIKFPFTNTTRPAHCGLITVDGCNKIGDVQKIRLEKHGTWYKVENISQADAIFIQDEMLLKHLRSRDCKTFNNLTFPTLPYISFEIDSKLDLFKCNRSPCNASGLEHGYLGCSNFSICRSRESENSSYPLPHCSYIQLPLNKNQNHSDIFQQITAQFSLSVRVSPSCRKCHYCRGGECLIDSRKNFYCSESNEGNQNAGLKIGLGVGVPAMVIVFLSFYAYRRYYKRKKSDFESAKSHSHPSSQADLEEGSIYFGVPVFSYNELEQATNSFDSEKELGDGGFGTVYHGKLRDGREVAVKRLCEHNYRRLEQFMNEIKILTRLHHKNLVSLYGCTSRRSRELLLVYEYIPNGTVADHLHGDRAKSSPLAWPLRLSIAIETSSALVYLHASDIIHRDVKTNNILLDNNFCVKVADFGLSRLFPSDVTHISTAPQGTPGYVDPEYHQCYQLTDKSDVYSFGVVLIELISSMPAVDISRHRDEINLANLAVNKIQNSAFDELIDQHLGYKSDEEVRRATTSVAELAFQCLQQDKELRPTMDEVLAQLKRIESGEYKENEEEQKVDSIVMENTMPPPLPPYTDEVALLKNFRLPPSPVSVAVRWVSSDSTTPNVSS